MPRRPQVATTVVMMLISLGCASSRTPSQERDARAAAATGDLVVAVVWPWQARRDILFRDGLQLALQEVNAAGGVRGRRIHIREEDDHESVNEGSLVAQRLANDPNVVAVIGHLQSYVAVPASAIYDMAGVVFVSPTSTTPELTNKGYARTFRTTFLDGDVGRRMADIATQRGYRRVAIYYVRNAYGRSLANAFEERADSNGVKVVQRASYEPGPNSGSGSFDATFREWNPIDIDAVFVAGQSPEAGELIASARHNGITVPMLGSDAMGTTSLLTAGGASVNGTIVPVAFHPDEQDVSAKRFVRAFRAAAHKSPDAGAAMAYDALTVLVQAMRAAPTSAPADVAKALHATRQWHGAAGDYTFDTKGDLVSPRIVTTVVRNGRFAYLDPETRTVAFVR